MKPRRDWLMAMAAAGLPAVEAAGETGAEAEVEALEPTLYIPVRHNEQDRAYVQQFLAAYPFAMVVTLAGGLRVTNVPTLLDVPKTDDWGTLWWHLAKNNHQNQALAAGGETTVIFHGPHSYISPNWCASKGNAVPTWNFAVAHCTGRAVRIEDEAQFAEGLARLVAENERKYGGGEWSLDKMPAEYLKGMRQSIIGYEMKIERVEAKFKLGHERSAADRASVLAALRAGKGAEKPMAALTAEYYARRPAK